MYVILTELAQRELEDAVLYYELEVDGLGIRFEEEVKRSVRRIVQFSKASSKEQVEVRRYVLHRFPYKILYSIEEEHIVIIAIAHQHRKPDYWIE